MLECAVSIEKGIPHQFVNMDQPTLFDAMDRDARSKMTWRPENPPSLDGIKDITFDTETDGLDWWNKDVFLGLAIRVPDGRSWYLPCRHKGGGNLDEEVLRRWCHRELRGKYMTGARTKFDVHVMREFGVDLEEQGNTVSDVQQHAALLDNERRKFNLNQLGLDYLGVGKKEIDGSRMAEYHAGEVQEYARWDVKLTQDLKDVMWKLMDEQDLHRVRALEDRTIFPVCEMEKNACPMDVEKLKLWNDECEQQYLRLLWKIHRETGLKINPKSNNDMEDLFDALGIEVTEWTDTGRGSFGANVLKKYDHPVIKNVLRAAQLRSIQTKYLQAYLVHIGAGHLLRYELHQTRTSTEGKSGEDKTQGVGWGRFSSSNKNIQQVFNPARQREKLGTDDFIIRELFIPETGRWLSADAMQVEFRLVAHYAQPPDVLAAYKEDPLVSFHKVVWDIVRQFTDISYKALKDLNFAKVYGAGVEKCAVMMGVAKDVGAKFVKVYDAKFPEIRILLRQAARVAEERGYVRTLLGRRARLKNRYHKALNNIIQGSAGDVMKQKLCEVHEARKETGFKMRVTVHDEVCGDVPDDECVEKVRTILNRQSFDLRVPILWDLNVGANWAEC